MFRTAAGLGCMLLLGAVRGSAQAGAEVDHRAVLEVGGAAERSLADRRSNGGATVAVEATPIEGLLELESGVTVLGTGADRRAAVDLLFKKPYRLSPTVEFMVGIGPEWSRPTNAAVRPTSTALEIVLDFMFWPTRNVGWYVEPSFSGSRGGNGERSLGATAGLLVGWPP